MYDFNIYTGKSTCDKEVGKAESYEKGKRKSKKPEKGKGLGYQVLSDLCQSLKWEGYHVYFDNFFTSGPLLDDLKKKMNILSKVLVEMMAKRYKIGLKLPTVIA